MESTVSTIEGVRGRIALHTWGNDAASFVAVIAHGLAEHAGRYDHVARALVGAGAVVYAPDHWGHGRSDGEPGVVDDVEAIVRDLMQVIERAKSHHAGLPMALIGHSLGGLIATRYAQQCGDQLRALVLSGPAIGGNAALLGMLELETIPDVAIDPALLSRDEAVGEAYAADPLVYSGPLRRETLLGIKAAVAAVAEGGTLGSIPTLWIHGSDDGLVPVAETRPVFDRIGGTAVEHKIYPGARHEIFNETNRSEVIADMLSFLARALS